MKKKLLSILALLCMAVTGAWADSFTITFKDNGGTSDSSNSQTAMDNIVADGSDYLESLSNLVKVTNGKAGYGIKIGNNSTNGTITLNLKESVMATKIVTKAIQYKAAEKTLKVNGEEFTLTEEAADYELTFTTPTEVSSIAFEATKHRAYILSVTVYSGTETPAGGEGTLSDEEFELTAVNGEYGTITFTVNDEKVEKAKEGDVVTVTVTPDDEHEVAGVTGLWYAAIAASRVVSTGTSFDMLTDIEFTPVEDTDNQWTFTMGRANAEVSASYWTLDDIIEMLREQMLLSKMLFEVYGGLKDDEKMEEMFYAINSSIILLRNYDNGKEVSLSEAYELYKALKKFNALFEQEIATGIKNVNVNVNDNCYYDLNGRRVTQPTKGIYILNGKKVVIK